MFLKCQILFFVIVWLSVAVNWPWRVSRGAEKKRTGGDRQRRGGKHKISCNGEGGEGACNIIAYLVDMELHRPLNHTILYAVSKQLSQLLSKYEARNTG